MSSMTSEETNPRKLSVDEDKIVALQKVAFALYQSRKVKQAVGRRLKRLAECQSVIARAYKDHLRSKGYEYATLRYETMNASKTVFLIGDFTNPMWLVK